MTKHDTLTHLHLTWLSVSFAVTLVISARSLWNFQQLVEKGIGQSKPFLIKPDRGGGGNSIRFYSEANEFRADPRPLESITGLYVVQEFILHESGVYRYNNDNLVS